VSTRRVIVWLLTGFAAFALVLASLGIYAVVSFGVAQRRREIGIRMALGASAGAVRERILLDTMRLAAPGMFIGLAASWVLARVMRTMLFGVTFWDPVAFAAALAILMSAAALAGYLPARTASRLHPVDALRAG
jgi:ABC-type antimicrobial peptide transport system permease subunit